MNQCSILIHIRTILISLIHITRKKQNDITSHIPNL